MARRLAAPALIVLAVAALYAGGITRPVQDWLTELRFGTHERAASGDIVLVEIDPRSLDGIGVWPWPRGIHARGIERLLAAGASEIVFDVDFSAPSSEEEDLALEQALEAAGGIVALPTFRQVWSAAAPRPEEHTNEPLPRFARHAWAASVNVFPDPDGKVRSLPLGDLIRGEFRPSVAALYGGLPPDAGASFGVDYSIDPATVPRLSYVDVLAGRLEPGFLAGKKVLIGAGAAELRDHFAVPFRGVMSGPMLQVIGAETVLQGRMLAHTSPVAVIVLLLAAAAVSSALRRRLSWKMYLGAMGVVALALEAGAHAVQIAAPLVIETAPLHLSIALMCAAALLSEVDIRDLLIRIANAETKAARDILDQVVADNFDGIVVLEKDGTILSANQSAARILRLGDGASAEGERAEDLLPKALLAHVREIFDLFAAGGPAPHEPAEFACRLGPDRAVLEFVATPSRLATAAGRGREGTDRTVVCLTFRDVTERNRARAEIAYMAHFDALTGLANRNRLHAELERMLAAEGGTGGHVAVIYFDLDRFKGVNDTLGHHYGDLLLKEVARRAQAHAGAAGIVARFGGDEFVLARAGIDSPEAAREIASALLESLRAACDLDGHRVIVGGSAGVALSSGDEATAELLIRSADAALHKAKAEGGNAACLYDPEFGERLLVRRQLELELWKAFERGEFEVFFQPLVDLADGRLCGAEALLRWKQPERGYVPAGEFIPVAEDIGLIPDLGAWILEAACEEAARWPAPLKVAVNVSSHQFRIGDLVATVERALARSGMDARRLELEITESVLADEDPDTTAILERVRAMEIGLALDDFGTGYSSLSYLRRFPITRLKVDRSFVSGLPEDAGMLAIVHAVTALSASLGLATTAEGIETPEQMESVRAAGCQQGQGYLFGKPMPASSFRAMMSDSGRPSALVA